MIPSDTRRQFLRFLSAAPAAGAFERPVRAAGRGKPNVLLICVDDLRPQLGCYGYKETLSPNIDRLASEGCLFARHYVQTAACGPSRATLLSGKPVGSWDCWGKLREASAEPSYPVSFPHVFRRGGYRTVCIGKVSHQPGGVMDEEQRVHQVPFSWDLSYAPTGAWQTPWRAFFSYAGGKAANAVVRMRKDEMRLPYEAADTGDDGYADGLNAAEAIKQLRDLKRRGGPFLLAVGFYKPHLPFNAPKKYWDRYDRRTVGLAAHRSAPRGVDPEISLHRSYEPTSHYYWPAGEGNISDDDARTLRHGYYACVSYVDAQIGKVLEEVKRLQLDRDTIVVLWSDHGWHLGEHGIFGKFTNHELAVRSPLLIKVPGLTKPGGRAQGLVEAVDLYPTLLDLCGLKAPAGLAGTSVLPMLRDPSHPGKQRAYSFCLKGTLTGRTLRTSRYRVVQWTNKEGRTVQVELYDHESDPGEYVNIAAEHPGLVRDLLARMPAAPGSAHRMLRSAFNAG